MYCLLSKPTASAASLNFFAVLQHRGDSVAHALQIGRCISMQTIIRMLERSLLGRFQILAMFAALVALTVVLVGAREAQPNGKVGDTLLYEEATANISAGAGATSEIFASTQYAIDHDIASQDFDNYEKLADAFQSSSTRNVLRFHANYILYVLAPFAALFGAGIVLAIFQIATFVGLLFAIYLWLREGRCGTLSSVLFMVVVCLHPAWSDAIRGQFYPDRGFVLLGFIYFVGLHDRWPIFSLVVIAAATSLLNERAPLILGLFTLGHAVMFFSRGDLKRFALKCAVGLTLVGTSVVFIKYSLENVYYAGNYMPNSLGELSRRLANPIFRSNLIVLIEINLGLIALGLFSWRTMPIVIGLMIPNMFGTVGGAEKIGFATHYHSYYFPALVWSAALGFLRIQTLVQGYTSKNVPLSIISPGIAIISLAPAVSFQLMDPAVSHFSFDLSRSILFTLPSQWSIAYGGQARAYQALIDSARRLVPNEATVSSTESTMWIGQGRAHQFLYPLSIARATHLGMRCMPNEAGDIKWRGVISFLGPTTNERLDAAFASKAVALGFDFAAAKCVIPLGIGIVPRRQSPS
jgi:hypothetical protein